MIFDVVAILLRPTLVTDLILLFAVKIFCWQQVMPHAGSDPRRAWWAGKTTRCNRCRPAALAYPDRWGMSQFQGRVHETLTMQRCQNTNAYLMEVLASMERQFSKNDSSSSALAQGDLPIWSFLEHRCWWFLKIEASLQWQATWTAGLGIIAQAPTCSRQSCLAGLRMYQSTVWGWKILVFLNLLSLIYCLRLHHACFSWTCRACHLGHHC